MEEKVMNEKESLELISQMIRNTQQRFERVNAAPFLAYGYATVLNAIVIWFLLNVTHNSIWNVLWMLIPLIGFVAMKLFFPKRKKGVKTHLDKAIDAVWAVVGCTMFFVGILTFFVNISVLFNIVLLMGIAMTLTGLMSRLKIIIYAGIIGVLASALFVFHVVQGVNVVLLFGAVFFVLMVVPGHFLYSQKSKQHV